jgi:hypothetical protein
MLLLCIIRPFQASNQTQLTLFIIYPGNDTTPHRWLSGHQMHCHNGGWPPDLPEPPCCHLALFTPVENAVTLQYHHAVSYPTRMWLVPFDDMTLPLACHDGHMTLRPTFYNVPGLLKDGGSKARTNSVFLALLPHSDGR